MLSGVALGLRGFQLLFSIVILGLAATLISSQVYGDSPTTTRYSTFTGGFGIIVACVGAAGLFISAIPELIVLGLDALSGILFAAGGIAWAVGLRGISCSLNDHISREDWIKTLTNDLINQGTLKVNDGTWYGVQRGTDDADVVSDRLSSNCKKGLADEVFQFLCFVLAVGLIVLGYIRMRKGGKTGGSSYVA
ncbi:Marvel domain containing protein [Naviculisporaceae sp. PSN 640]